MLFHTANKHLEVDVVVEEVELEDVVVEEVVLVEEEGE